MRVPPEYLRRLDEMRDALTPYTAHLLWSRADLEDALQETMIVGCRKYRDFKPGTDFRAWIFRIATLICFNLNRRFSRDNGAATPAGAAPVTRREFTSEQILRKTGEVLQEMGDGINRAIRRLTEKERAILLLKSVGGLTCEEIVEVLDVPLGTAQGLLTRARNKVRESLEKDEKVIGRNS